MHQMVQIYLTMRDDYQQRLDLILKHSYAQSSINHSKNV